MFKYLIILSLCSLIYGGTIFQMDLKNGGYGNKFVKFQDQGPSYAQDATDESTLDPVITFSALSKYSGIITKDWITSSTGVFYITIYFKGKLKRITI